MHGQGSALRDANTLLFSVLQMAQSCGGEAVSMQGAVVKALVRLAAERPVVIFAAKNGELRKDGERKGGRRKTESKGQTS